MTYHPLLSVLAVVAVGVVAAATVGPSVWRVRAAVALAVVALPWPFLAPSPAGLRSVLAFIAAWNVMRVLEVGKRGGHLPPWRRIAHVLLVFDTLGTVRARPRRDGRRFALALVWALLAGGALWGALGVDPAAAWYLPARWGLGAVAFYAGFETMVALTVAILRLIGLEPPVAHDNPALSRSIQEFWGVRWNRVVHGWLKAFCFDPVRRRAGTVAAVVATFGVSAVHHGYLVWPAQGFAMALSVAAFFAVQPALLLMERALRARRWPTPWRRVFTVSVIGGTSPFIIEPVLRVIESAS